MAYQCRNLLIIVGLVLWGLVSCSTRSSDENNFSPRLSICQVNVNGELLRCDADTDSDGMSNLWDQCPVTAGAYLAADCNRATGSFNPLPSDNDDDLFDDPSDDDPKLKPPKFEGITYWEHVKPIVDAKCVRCHSKDKLRDDLRFQDYESLKNAMAMIESQVVDDLMPPWLPHTAEKNTDSTCDTTYSNDHSLTIEQKGTILSWIEDGGQEGDKEDEGSIISLNEENWSSDNSYAVSSYLPKIHSDGRDDVACFLIDPELTENVFLTAFRLIPGNPKIVRKALAFMVVSDFLGDFGDVNTTHDCIVPVSATYLAPLVGQWQAGTKGAVYPEGTGIKLMKNSKIFLQVYYKTAGVSVITADKSYVEIRTESSVASEALFLPGTSFLSWLDNKKLIPKLEAGDSSTHIEFDNFRFSDVKDYFSLLRALYSGTDIEAILHEDFFDLVLDESLHVNGVSMSMLSHGAKGSIKLKKSSWQEQCLVDIQDWRQEWFDFYWLKDSYLFTEGDSLTLSCEWNKSSTSDIGWGSGDDEDICIGYLYVYQ